MQIVVIFLVLSVSFLANFRRAQAYPEFIGYKYSSCLTCHYNGQGNGALNDYGRALWSAEIAGRAFAGGRSDEQLAEASGFLGSTKLPWWIKPGVKGRNLWVRPNPGGVGDTREILMQADINAAVLFDRDEKYALVASLGYAPVPAARQGTAQADEIPTYISREHYLRVQASEELWLYLGMMDKVYGIRTVNHTAYNRGALGLGQNDQSHGLMVHWIKPQFELTTHVFAGNLFQQADLRQQGASMMAEYEWREAWRLGASVLSSTNEYIGNQRFGLHSRAGFGHGASVLFEIGTFVDQVKLSGAAESGQYLFGTFTQRLVRGYHLFVGTQALKTRLGSAAEQTLFKPSIGFLVFPMARVEFRFDLENIYTVDSLPTVRKDGWLALGQIHFSL